MGSDRNSMYSAVVMYVIVMRIKYRLLLLSNTVGGDVEWLKDILLFPLHKY
jgi:hypothetical protein